MKKLVLIFIILIFSLTFAILFNPKTVEGTNVMLRVDTQDIKEVFYKARQRTVLLVLQREINNITRLNFRNFNKTEALLLMEMLTSQRGIIIEVDPDDGYVYDYGFSVRFQ